MRMIHVVNESCSRDDLMMHKVCVGIVTVFVTVEFARDGANSVQKLPTSWKV